MAAIARFQFVPLGGKSEFSSQAADDRFEIQVMVGDTYHDLAVRLQMLAITCERFCRTILSSANASESNRR